MSPTTPPVVYLHIGTMKSGTSYVQGMLWRNREVLHDNGVLYPGKTWQDQVDAVRDVIEAKGAHRRPDVSGKWDVLRDEILGWTGPKALLSMEFLSLAQPNRVAAAVKSLAPAEVHAVITARDLGRVLPSAWQESTQNRQTWTWPAYVSSITGRSDAEPTAFKRFWNQHDVADIARTWAEVIGTDHVHIVLVPPSGGPRDELWRRFCSVVGLDHVAYAGADVVRGNPAVGAASAEFLRRLNIAIGRDLDVPAYERLVKRFLAKSTLANRSNESRLVLPASYHDWATERAGQMITELRASGVDIVGDLDELMPLAPSAGDDAAAGEENSISEEEVADAGLHAVEALVLRLAQVTSRGDKSGSRGGKGGPRGQRAGGAPARAHE